MTRRLVRYDTAMEATTRPAQHARARSDTFMICPRGACNPTGVGPAIRHPAHHDTAQCALGLSVVNTAWAHRVRSQGLLGGHPVHST